MIHLNYTLVFMQMPTSLERRKELGAPLVGILSWKGRTHTSLSHGLARDRLPPLDPQLKAKSLAWHIPSFQKESQH